MYLIAADSFMKQWERVLCQNASILCSGGTLKEALLAYQYPRNLPNLTKDKTSDVIPDMENGELYFPQYDETVRLYWEVSSSEEVGTYWFNTRYALCPDGTVLMFD
ncbi:hypothetical protein L4X63_15755 [Geomonas sp. Red32]|uniref:hypothetical protein n=1 Tax=Geomonas sp. Red32 TaxID=2912856 RepID=UPI00202CD638|nr:hypothetical protein [Geomonas sp. Red32]MCM0083047.1 hypothetical protein [Geomonas sp. Red32]